MIGIVKGWCPSAYRPMMSGDGLLVRVKPQLGRLSVDQAFCLADTANRFGNGVIDLTRRANVQLRGVSEADHGAVLEALSAAELIDPDPVRERRRSIVVTPFWQPGDANVQLAKALDSVLMDLPEMPDKIGFSLDAVGDPVLGNVPADFRFEQGADGGLILVAAGSDRGASVDLDTAMPTLAKLAAWFVETGGNESGRMERHLVRVSLPEEFAKVDRLTTRAVSFDANLYGVPFGSMLAKELAELVAAANPSGIRITPWRMLILEGGTPVEHPKFVRKPRGATMGVSACPGAPACASASVETRALATQLVDRVPRVLHVSGCAKGCARSKAAGVTLVGRDGHFDLVENGRASDTPVRTGLSEADVLELFP